MKKIVFYIPAIVFTISYGWLSLNGIGAIHPIVVVWLFLFWAAGIILSKSIFWGGILGILPAIQFIYMSTQETGQALDIELPLGIVVLLYYSICGYYVYRNKNAKNNS